MFEGHEGGVADIRFRVVVAFEHDHFVRFSRDGGADRERARLKRFVHVYRGGEMRAAPLHEAELDGTHLDAEPLLDDARENGGKAAESGMSEMVVLARLEIADVMSFRILEPFGDDSNTLALVAFADIEHVLHELVHAERHFGEIDEIRAESGVVRQRRRGGEPAGVAPHDFYDADKPEVVDLGVEVALHHGGGDILRRARKPRTMVGAVEVVVYGLGHTDDVALVALLFHILADLVARVHAVVAAVVEEKADVVLPEHFEKPAVVRVVVVVVLELVSGRTERRRGRVPEELEFVHVLFGNIVKLFLQYAEHAVLRAVDRSDVVLFQRFEEYACRAAVDDCGGASALAKHARSLQTFHNFSSILASRRKAV